jgi:S-adenosyl methyltransferase
MTYQPRLPEDYFRKPSSARVWNYWMGGKDNYPIDREVGDAVAALDPTIIPTARESRRFLIRAVRYLAESGVRQFLDIGTGLPTEQNTHEVAQSVAPDSKIVYVDNDPVVLAHARALLVTTNGVGTTEYVDCDLNDPGRVLTEASRTLDFNRPVAVLFMGTLGHVPELERARAIVGEVMDAVVPGGFLAMYDGVQLTESNAAGVAKEAEGGVSYVLRAVTELERLLDGLEVVEPGFVPVHRWRPPVTSTDDPGDRINAYGAVGRKR